MLIANVLLVVEPGVAQAAAAVLFRPGRADESILRGFHPLEEASIWCKWRRSTLAAGCAERLMFCW